MNEFRNNLRNKIPLAISVLTLVVGHVISISASAQTGDKVASTSTTEAQASSASETNTRLPYANGREFRSLDEYLAFRKTLGTTDRPWYEEISPGIYYLKGGRRLPASRERTYTRQELMEKFAFTR
jgi:hypothetical protein